MSYIDTADFELAGRALGSKIKKIPTALKKGGKLTLSLAQDLSKLFGLTSGRLKIRFAEAGETCDYTFTKDEKKARERLTKKLRPMVVSSVRKTAMLNKARLETNMKLFTLEKESESLISGLSKKLSRAKSKVRKSVLKRKRKRLRSEYNKRQKTIIDEGKETLSKMDKSIMTSRAAGTSFISTEPRTSTAFSPMMVCGHEAFLVIGKVKYCKYHTKTVALPFIKANLVKNLALKIVKGLERVLKVKAPYGGDLYSMATTALTENLAETVFDKNKKKYSLIGQAGIRDAIIDTSRAYLTGTMAPSLGPYDYVRYRGRFTPQMTVSALDYTTPVSEFTSVAGPNIIYRGYDDDMTDFPRTMKPANIPDITGGGTSLDVGKRMYDEEVIAVQRMMQFPVTVDEVRDLVRGSDAAKGEGKSGSDVFFNPRIFVKSLNPADIVGLKKYFPAYVKHLKRYGPETRLPAFYLVFRLLKNGKAAGDFVVMRNMLEGVPRPYQSYDLKGSYVGRLNKQEKGTLKDNNFRGQRLVVDDSTGWQRVRYFLGRDVKLLRGLGLMDYSLLLIISATPWPGSLAGKLNGQQVHFVVHIVDVLLPYHMGKRVEAFFKKKGASSKPPAEYAARFLDFIDFHIVPQFAGQYQLENVCDDYPPVVRKEVPRCR